MRRSQRIVLLATLIAIAPVIAGCADFDLDKLDVFHLNDKKKLPGDRRELFPGGVPGVTQGIPSEYMKGNQAAPDTALAAPVAPVSSGQPANPQSQAAAAPEPKSEPKAKPKPKQTAKRKPKPKPPADSAATTPAAQPAAAQTPPPAWPTPAQQPQQAQAPSAAPSPWPAQQQNSGAAPWPAAPPPGSFSR